MGTKLPLNIKKVTITVEDNETIHKIEIPFAEDFMIEQRTSSLTPGEMMASGDRQEIQWVNIGFKPLRNDDGIAYTQSLELKHVD